MKIFGTATLAAALVALATTGASAQPAECLAPAFDQPIIIEARADGPGATVGGEAAARDAALALSCAEAGVAGAQWNLGRMYINGWGVGLDLVAAEAWYRRAAEQGFAYAEVSLGVFLTQGEPSDAALVEALMWFERGAYQGISYAMMRTAEAYALGLGTPVDLTTAAMWYIVATGFDEDAAEEPLTRLQMTMQRGRFAEAEQRATAWANAWNAGLPMGPR